MKIIYLHQYFNLPEDGGSLRSYFLARALVENNHVVEIITSTNRKHYSKKETENIIIHYLPVFYDNQLGVLGRLWSFLKFTWQSYSLATKIRDVDLVYATSTPLTIGITALLLKRRKKTPYFFEVRDLWPQAPIELGFIKNAIFKKTLYYLEKKMYLHANRIIALSPGIQESIQTKVPDKEVLLIPNMADCDFFQFLEKDDILQEKYFMKGKFVITYFGTVGYANHLEYLLEIASFFKERSLNEVVFLIVGKGARLEHIKKQTKEKKLINIRFLSHTNKSEIREILNISDACYISFLQKPVLETTSPNKFFDALAAGKLCIVNTKGWLKDLVEENQCGFYANPENPHDFYNQILPYIQNHQLLKDASQNARNLAENHFSVKKLSSYFLSIFEDK